MSARWVKYENQLRSIRRQPRVTAEARNLHISLAKGYRLVDKRSNERGTAVDAKD